VAIAPNTSAPLFSESASSTLRLILYLAAAIMCMVADHRGDYLERVRRGASVLAEPLYRLAAMPSQLARDTRAALADRASLTERNAELSRELMLAQTRLRHYDAVQEQNQRLQELLAVQKTLGLSVQLARVIDVDFGAYRRQHLMLDIGSDQGVGVGQPVIDAHGVVGQVVEVRAKSCTVMLITDERNAIPVRIERTGLRTIARGGGTLDTLELLNIPVSADVKVGDHLVRSVPSHRIRPACSLPPKPRRMPRLIAAERCWCCMNSPIRSARRRLRRRLDRPPNWPVTAPRRR